MNMQEAENRSAGVCVSAPGKVLITGGYLVLDPKYAGLVLASTARFYARASSKAQKVYTGEDAADTIHVNIESPQFNQVVRGVLRRGAGDAYQFLVDDGSDRNAYIEETLLCTINGIEGVAPTSVARKAQELRGAQEQLHVLLQADNDFYSQVKRFQSSSNSLHRRNLAALQKCLPPYMEEKPNGERVAMKTGMGSSAALVTSLVGALVCFFLPENRFEERDADLELIHNLAQLSHCFVQRKIGSGFDVSAACFGSQRYTRFPASILGAFTTQEALQPAALQRALLDRCTWDVANRVKRFKLPLSLCLFMGDVSAGSSTVSMARQVLSWQKAQPVEAERITSRLNLRNSHVEVGFTNLLALFESPQHDTSSFEKARREMAKCTFDQWQRVDPVLGHILSTIREEFLAVRTLLREMGDLAGVPVEPTEQTTLVDATMAIPGVLIAGVPGAGGFDAVFVVTLDESVLNRVEELWEQWPQTHPTSIICPLLCDADPGRGLRLEK